MEVGFVLPESVVVRNMTCDKIQYGRHINFLKLKIAMSWYLWEL